MKFKQVVSLLVLLLLMDKSYGQVINADSLNVYPESVVLKVYEVASKVPLTVSKQVALADLFTEEEQNLYNLTINGASIEKIDSTKLYYHYQFNNTLTASELEAYYNNKVKTNADRMGRLTSKMLGSKYKTDATIQQYLQNIYTSKQTTIDKVLLQYTDSAVLDTNVYSTIMQYDSLSDLYIKAASGSSFLNTKLSFLDSAVGIDSNQRIALSNTYYNLCLGNTSVAYGDIFNTAFSLVFTQVSDTPYYAAYYGKEIANNTRTNTQVAIAGYVKKYNLSSTATQALLPILLRREWGLAIINKVYPYYTVNKGLLVDTIIKQYEPSIDSIISLDGNMVFATQIDIAIKYSSSLGLDQSQIEQLSESLNELNTNRREFRLKDPVGEFDSKVFESNRLTKILTEDQYTNVLTLKYQGTADAMAKQDWNEISKHADLVAEFDSARIISSFTNYHLAYLIAFYRNAADQEKQYASCKRIHEIMPEELKMLIDKFEYKSAYGDGSDTFFQW